MISTRDIVEITLYIIFSCIIFFTAGSLFGWHLHKTKIENQLISNNLAERIDGCFKLKISPNNTILNKPLL